MDNTVQGGSSYPGHQVAMVSSSLWKIVACCEMGGACSTHGEIGMYKKF
jgi:hypothetical protein